MTDNTDERLGTNALSVARRTRQPDASAPSEGDKADRALDDREVTENREFSEAERVERYRLQNYASHLPNIPDIPGWHACWLTTTNSGDSIQDRMSLGYEPIKLSEVPGMEPAFAKEGEFAGFLKVKEMVAFKLPMTLYQRYMAISHYEQPLEQQEGITANIDALREQALSMDGKLVEGDGMSELRQSAPRMKQFS